MLIFMALTIVNAFGWFDSQLAKKNSTYETTNICITQL